jgi:hypothetical protein
MVYISKRSLNDMIYNVAHAILCRSLKPGQEAVNRE